MIALWQLHGNKPEVLSQQLGLKYGSIIESFAIRQNQEIESGKNGHFITCIQLAENSVNLNTSAFINNLIIN